MVIIRVGRLWHGLLALVIAVCLVIQVVLVVADDGSLVNLFSYFTIQSNILVLLTAATIAVRPAFDSPLWRVLRLDGLLGIVITGVVYATVLAATNNPHGWALVTDSGFHWFAPWWTLAGWLLFGPRPRIDRRTLVWAVLWPVLWIAWTLIHGAATDWYPYPFTDVVALGYPFCARSRALAASISRSFGAAVVTRCASNSSVAAVTAATAWSKAAWLACEGLVDPATLRTYCSAAAATSSCVAGGSKLCS